MTSGSRVLAQARWELRLLLRNGEQILLLFVIPVALLIGLYVSGLSPLGGGISTLVPTVIAVSVLGTSFTSLAIGTGFERRSGALAFLGTTPLSRTELLLGKALSVSLVAIASIGLICGVSLGLGWVPGAAWPAFAAIVLVSCAALAAWAVYLAGALRAEAVLAISNGIFVLLMIFGGILIPASSMPAPVDLVVGALPSSALAEGLRSALDDAGWPWSSLGLLAAWGVVGALLARRTFRWAP
jgi:ABC-2 type transport system permease protein